MTDISEQIEDGAQAIITAGPWPRPKENVQEYAERAAEAVIRAAGLPERLAELERLREESRECIGCSPSQEATWARLVESLTAERDEARAAAGSSDSDFVAELVGDEPLRREGFQLACDAFEDAVQSASREADGATWVRTDTVRKALAVASTHAFTGEPNDADACICGERIAQAIENAPPQPMWPGNEYREAARIARTAKEGE